MRIPFQSPTSNNIKDRNIDNTDIQKYYPSINKSTSYDELLPYIEDAIKLRIFPYIDKRTYDFILTTTDNDAINEIRDSLSRAIIRYALYIAIPKMNVRLSDMGATETRNDNTSPVSQWRYKAIRWDLMLDADRYLDIVLAEIEQNIDLFIDLPITQEYKDRTTKLFKSTKSYARYQKIEGMRAFFAILPYLREAEEDAAELLCSEAQYIFSSDETYSVFQDKVRAYVAALGMYNAVPHVAMIFEGNGFKLVSSTDTFDSKNPVNNTWSDGSLDKLRQSLKETASKYKDRLIKYIGSNETLFPEWHEANMQSCGSPSEMIITPRDGIGGVYL